METTMRTVLYSACLAITLMLAGTSVSLAGFNPFGTAGLKLTKADYAEIAKASEPLFSEQAAIGMSQDWANPKSGNSGTIRLLDRYATQYEGKSLPCRKLEYTVVSKALRDPYNLVLNRCRTADGSWKIF